MDRINVLGVSIDNVDMTQAVKIAGEYLEHEKTRVIFTPNPEIIMKTLNDNELRNIINSGDLLIPDGIGIVQAAKTLKTPVKERVTGYDLAHELLLYSSLNGKKVFFFGAAKGVAKNAAVKMKKRYSRLNIAGCHSGFFNEEDNDRIIAKINNSDADILLVGLSAPKQEKWVYQNKDKLKAKIVMCVGGSFDGMAGNFPRAPKIFIDLGVEWLYRLIKQPSRAKRMSILPVFKVKVWLSKWK